MFGAIDTSATGMTAERLRMDTIADNLANSNTTRTEDGGPYMRKVVRLEPREKKERGIPGLISLPRQGLSARDSGRGVRATEITEAEGEPKRVHDPSHPDAGEDGYVEKPNVEPVKEMVDMITASRAFQANTTAVESAKQMFNRALQIAH